MAKTRTQFVCQECGTRHEKWQGQCKGCQAWNTLVEETISQVTSGRIPVSQRKYHRPTHLSEVRLIEEERIRTPDPELNRVLGGGIVPGSLVLLGGEPGIGKSTLLLQLALQLNGPKVLYVSGEESEQQIRMRAERIQASNPELLLFAENNLERVLESVKEVQPELLIIDSIQTLYTEVLESAPGSVAQVRDCTARLMKLAKDSSLPVFLVGHITKEGTLAGPKVLEHMVDTVLTFEGDKHHEYRIVRAGKNRFGAAFELGVYRMHSQGLEPVANPSELFLSLHGQAYSGVAISAMLEGARPILIETQALVAPTGYATPQRSATGFDLRRLHMLLAVLEKRSGIKLAQKDVFINIAGGLSVDDPALDLGLMCAVVSSLHDLPIPSTMCFAAEVGLSGEIRAVSRLEQRAREAAKLGFKEMIVAESGGNRIDIPGLQLRPCKRVEEAFRMVFGGK